MFIFSISDSTRENRGEGASTLSGFLEAFHDRILDLKPVLDKFNLGESALLADMYHAGKSFGTRIGKNVYEIGGDGFWPNGHGATELLQPDLAPILAHRSWEEL